MSIISKIRKLCRISLYKTARMNIHYFRLGGVHPRFIVSKNVLIKGLRGSVSINEGNVVWLGFGDVGFVDQNCERFIWDVSGSIIFNGNASFSPGCRIICMDRGQIQFGKEFSCNARSKIICNTNIIFGDDCMISWDCTFIDTDFHKILDSNSQQKNLDKAIVVGNHVWVCAEVLVLKGAKIPDETVVGARSVVSKELAPGNCVFHNSTAVVENVRWEK